MILRWKTLFISRNIGEFYLILVIIDSNKVVADGLNSEVVKKTQKTRSIYATFYIFSI